MPGRSIIAALGLVIGLAAIPARAQVLEIATDQSPVGLDPHVATAFSTTMVLSTIYEGLTAISPDLRAMPALAESWSDVAGRPYLHVPSARRSEVPMTARH